MLHDDKASSRWLFPFQDSCGCFCMVVAGFKWLLMVGYSIGCLRSVLDGDGRFWSDLWIDFSSFVLTKVLPDTYG